MYWYVKHVYDRFKQAGKEDALFYREPFSVDEFLDSISFKSYIWPSVQKDLHETFDKHIEEVVKIDGVGSGKSVYLVLSIVYVLLVLSTIKDPGRLYGLIPGSKVGLVIMSLRQFQAREIIFDEVGRIMLGIEWMRENYPYRLHREAGLSMYRFPNGVYLLSGGASETIPIGFSILYGCQDEALWMLNKCVDPDTLLITSTGLTKITDVGAKDVFSGQKWETPSEEIEHTGLRCRRITLKSGLSLIGADDHRIKMLGESRTRIDTDWKALKDVGIGDVALLKMWDGKFRETSAVKNFKTEEVRHELARFLGVYDSVGKIKRCVFKYTSIDTRALHKITVLRTYHLLSMMEEFVYVIKPMNILSPKLVKLVEEYSLNHGKGILNHGAYFESYMLGRIEAEGTKEDVGWSVPASSNTSHLQMMCFATGYWADRKDHYSSDGRYEHLHIQPIRTRNAISVLPSDLQHTTLIKTTRGVPNSFSGSKLKKALRRERLMIDTVIRNESVDSRTLRDLTIPNSHAYVSNFFISHNSHKGDDEDQAANIYNAIKDRIETRFDEKGLIQLVSSARKVSLFAEVRAKEVEALDTGYVTRRAVWEAKPRKWGPFFAASTRTAKVLPELGLKQELPEKTEDVVWIPLIYKQAYDRNPMKFLRNRASVLSMSGKKFVLRPDLLKFNTKRKNPVLEDGMIDKNFKPSRNSVYYSHCDLGESRDSAVLTFGHQKGPLTVIDMIYVINPIVEGVVDFNRVRSVIFELAARGFHIELVTFDRFASTEVMQLLDKRGFSTEIHSVDRDPRSYHCWLEAHYDELIDVPLVDGYLENAQSLLLLPNGKIDHEETGGKDITDSVAGTTWHCRTLGVNSMDVNVLGTALKQQVVDAIPTDLQNHSLPNAPKEFMVARKRLARRYSNARHVPHDRERTTHS